MNRRCHRHPDGPRYTRPDGSRSECVPCRRERERRQTDRPGPRGVSAPGKLAGRVEELLAVARSGIWTQREVAAAFGVSEGRVSQLLRRHDEETAA